MSVSQTKNNLRWSFFVFGLLCFVFSTVYVIADEVSTTDVVVFNDTDTDGLSNEEEKTYGTDPEVADTDGDGYSDGVEIEGGFDPLKPAPGDRIISDETASGDNSAAGSDENNLTGKATDALAEVIAAKGEDGSITSEDLNSVLEQVTSATQDQIELPEVDISSIKVKKLSSRLSADEKEEAIRKDVIEYLTLVSYILISNAPVQIRDEKALGSFISESGKHIILSLVSGDFSYLDTIEERSQKALEEINNIEVPERMVESHVKAIKMLTFASNLKQSFKQTVSVDDPLGQLYMFSKVQGFLMTLNGFQEDVVSQLTDMGVKNIPLDI
jgi:hypothetical protein